MDQTIGRDVPFAVSARTAKLIGFENFSNADGAVIELVKNTYDADAKNCVMIFDIRFLDDKNENIDREKSKIYIVDNGTGMTEETILTRWMTIGTNNKVTEFLSEKARIKSGAKGIGRFALNRLGKFTRLCTYSKDEQSGLEWQVKWSDFDVEGKNVSDITAKIDIIPGMQLKDIFRKIFPQKPILHSYIENIRFDSGTIIEIGDINDDWEVESLKKLYENLETLLPPKEERDFSIDLFYLPDLNFFGKVNTAYYDDFDYKVKAYYDGQDTIELMIHRNELDLDIMSSKSFHEVFEIPEMKKYPYRLEDMQKGIFTHKLSISKLFSNVSPELINRVGSFDFTFYFLKNTRPNDPFPYRSFNSAHRKSWLKKFGGVKIFRDEFRVRPYGEYGDDWLHLGERQAQSPGGPGQKKGGYRIGPNQISGSIHISRIHNGAFQDKSGREGIIENEVFYLFRNILKETIHFFEEDRNTIMFNLSELAKRKDKEAEDLILAEEEAARVIKEKEARLLAEEEAARVQSQGNTDKGTSSPSNDIPEENNSSPEETLATGFNILKNQLSEQEEELRLLRSLASTGLIISSFAHELKSLEARLIPRTTNLLSVLEAYIPRESLKEIDPDDNPYYMIELIQGEDMKIKNWLEYALNTLKRDKRERKNLDFSIYFDRLKSTWIHAFEDREILLQIHGESECIMRAFEVDMDSIFNNLIANSIYAFRKNGAKPKEINIEWKRIGNVIEILFADTGPGLDEKYKDNPEKIFDFNESSRRDKHGNITGTGLGLYMVSTILDEYDHSTISVIRHVDEFVLRITFQLPLGHIE